MKMTAFHHIFRWFGVISGWPIQMVYFKRKVYFQNKNVQGRRIKGGALVISNHYNPLDFVTNAFMLFPRMLYIVASEYAAGKYATNATKIKSAHVAAARAKNLVKKYAGASDYQKL